MFDTLIPIPKGVILSGRICIKLYRNIEDGWIIEDEDGWDLRSNFIGGKLTLQADAGAGGSVSLKPNRSDYTDH